MRRSARKPRIADDQRRIVFFLGFQKMQQRHRMRFGRVSADQKDRPRIVNVVVGVCHRSVAPGVGNTCDRGRVANTRLVIDIVRAPIGSELAHQIGLLVAVLGRTQPVDGVGAGTVAHLQHLVADFVDGFFPGNAGPFAAGELHRIFQAAFAVRMLTHRRALGAMRSKIERGVKAWLLSHPDAVLDLGHHRAADRTVRTDRFFHFQGTTGALRRSLCNHPAGKGGSRSNSTSCEAGTFQKCPPVDRRTCQIREGRRQPGAACHAICLLPEHVHLLPNGPPQRPPVTKLLLASVVRTAPAYRRS